MAVRTWPQALEGSETWHLRYTGQGSTPAIEAAPKTGLCTLSRPSVPINEQSEVLKKTNGEQSMLWILLTP